MLYEKRIKNKLRNVPEGTNVELPAITTEKKGRLLPKKIRIWTKSVQLENMTKENYNVHRNITKFHEKQMTKEVCVQTCF